MVRIYRKIYMLITSKAILFNHESPRRGVRFVTRKITQGSTRLKLAISSDIHIGILALIQTWPFAREFASAIWIMLV
jgi:GDPmannose 4,6-dehydratase